jgi:HlyD family secretion protein
MKKNRKNKVWRYSLAAAVVAVPVVFGVRSLRNPGDDRPAESLFRVARGPLVISVDESGAIRAREMVVIKNEVEGRRSILSLVPEGRRVRKGDLLVELDSSSLVDAQVDQDIRVQNTQAAFINAEENLAVVENQTKSDVDKARLTLRFAEEDLRKYREGDYPNERTRAEAQITLAEEELARARETLKWSRTLAAEKFISQSELQADELLEKKRALDLELARNNLRLLTEYVYKRTIAQLESDVQQATMALERVTRKARADTVQAQANLKARKAEYRRQKARLERIQEQIGLCRIVAPADGQVIYATSAQQRRWNVEPLAEGTEVRQRQELIHLPATASTKAEINIHESNLEKVKLGMPAEITADALPGRVFRGTVARIAPLPDAQSMWMNPDLKVYRSDIHIDTRDEDLRTGMSCKARIIVAEYEDVLYVPIQCVMRVGGRPTVYVAHGRTVEPRVVKTGLDNNRMVHVLAGVQEGEAVLLAPPLAAAETVARPSTDRAAESAEPLRPPADIPAAPTPAAEEHNDRPPAVNGHDNGAGAATEAGTENGARQPRRRPAEGTGGRRPGAGRRAAGEGPAAP